MILPTKYDRKKTYTRKKCEVCGRNRITCQHHIDGRRYSDQVIDVCTNGSEVFYTDPCHSKIHNPTAFGLPSSWAYDNGYLRRRTNNIMKKSKKKSCSHKAQVYDLDRDCLVCQFCRQEVKEFSGTKPKPIEKKHKAQKSIKIKAVVTKMGYEKQNPQIIEAEKMKRKLTSLHISIKKCNDDGKLLLLLKEKRELLSKMRKLQDELES